MKRVFIIHGYKSYPNDCWFPRLKKELLKRGFRVSVPRLPNPANPSMKHWVSTIKKTVKEPDGESYFIGHSLGFITILRYLETLKPEQRVGGVISVGGRIIKKRHSLQTASFFENPIQWRTIKKRANRFVGIYSTDDSIVSIENGRLIQKKLMAKLVLERNKGHFSREDKIFKLQSVARYLFIISDM